MLMSFVWNSLDLPYRARRPLAATGAAQSNRPCKRCAPPLRALGVAAVDVLFTAETQSTRSVDRNDGL
jgi:hypothetical protein